MRFLTLVVCIFALIFSVSTLSAQEPQRGGGNRGGGGGNRGGGNASEAFIGFNAFANFANPAASEARRLATEKLGVDLKELEALYKAYTDDKSDANKEKIAEKLGAMYDANIAEREKALAAEKENRDKTVANALETVITKGVGQPRQANFGGGRGNGGGRGQGGNNNGGSRQ